MSYQQSPLVDSYVNQFSNDIQERITLVRRAIQSTFPNTIEDISYGIPTYRPAPKKRGVVHFGVTKNHIGIYGILDPNSDTPINEIMKPYRTGKGTLQFAHTDPLPKQAIQEILSYQATKISQQ